MTPMTDAALQALAQRHVPGSGALRLEPLREGLVNRSVRVSRDGRVFVLRVEGAATGVAPGVDRAWECRVLRSAAAAGLAPAVMVCDPPAGVLVTAWAEGVAWSAEEAASLSAQKRVAALARRVHALALPLPARHMSVRGWRDLYQAQWHGAPPGAAQAADLAQGESLLQQYEALPPAQPRLCHSDLHRHNLLATAHDCVLLDWEYAHAGDPFWDLAGWARSNDLQRSHVDALLRAYLLREPTREEEQRLALLMQIYDLICRLWAALAAPQPPRAP